jgi:hypothetical protein
VLLVADTVDSGKTAVRAARRQVIEDRSERASTLIASQLPSTAWHAAIGEPSVADAICDRVIHRAHRLTLKGPTMRDPGTRRGTKALARAISVSKSETPPLLWPEQIRVRKAPPKARNRAECALAFRHGLARPGGMLRKPKRRVGRRHTLTLHGC